MGTVARFDAMKFELGERVRVNGIIPDVSGSHGLSLGVFFPDKIWIICGVCLRPHGIIYRLTDEDEAYTGWIPESIVKEAT